MTTTRNDLSKLLDTAVERHWCTSHQCTTCGSNQFRSALDKFDRNALIKQLSELDEGYFDRRGAILMIIYRASLLPMARDLLEPLRDSPAGKFLQKAIEIQERRDHNRRLQEQMSTPEAIAARLAARKEKRRLLTEGHRMRKVNAQKMSIMCTDQLEPVLHVQPTLKVAND